VTAGNLPNGLTMSLEREYFGDADGDWLI